MKEQALEILLRYIDNTKEANDALSELLVLFDVSNCASLEREVNSRRQQITDINQWTEILIAYRHKIRERVLWSMINDINNRTTD
jgi:hypothetical protein